jgi:hypothetical protein
VAYKSINNDGWANQIWVYDGNILMGNSNLIGDGAIPGYADFSLTGTPTTGTVYVTRAWFVAPFGEHKAPVLRVTDNQGKCYQAVFDYPASDDKWQLTDCGF